MRRSGGGGRVEVERYVDIWGRWIGGVVAEAWYWIGVLRWMEVDRSVGVGEVDERRWMEGMREERRTTEILSERLAVNRSVGMREVDKRRWIGVGLEKMDE